MILFCATDAGGARELLPVIEESKRKGITYDVYSSTVTASILKESKQVLCTSVEQAKQLLQETKATVFVGGTTGTIGCERYLTAAARSLGIPSVIILDEWYNYALRFQDEHGQLGNYLPDHICAQDDRSVELATQEGIPRKILTITGSPALAQYTKRAAEFMLNPPAIPSLLRAKGSAATVLFLSQPLHLLYGQAAGEHGSHGTFLGFSEESVREDLREILSTVQRPICVIEKQHPSERKKSPPLNFPTNCNWYIDRGTDTLWPLLWHCDVIIGMNTKALLEAAILGRRGISYQPNALRPTLCTAALLNLAELHTTKANLAERLPQLLTATPKRVGAPLELTCAPANAAEQVLALVERL